MSSRVAVMEAVEKLSYRVTVGDVSAQAGLNLNTSQHELLSLATDVGGHMQVAESGEVAYVFPPNFRNILLSRSFKLQIQAWLQTVWKWLFYLIRISFGIVLIISIAIVVMAIIVALIALNSSSKDDRGGGGGSSDRSYGGGGGNNNWGGWIWLGNPFSVFTPDYYEPEQRRLKQRERDAEPEMGFLEGVFSFLFGDGNPNADLEDRRWQAIATVIRNNSGVVTAEQITPYLDELGTVSEGNEDYIIPVLVKFNGQPQVSDRGDLVYCFPDLQKVASERKQKRVSEYLKETPWQFSKAGAGKISLSVGLGIFYFVGALILGGLLRDPRLATQLTGFLGFASAAYGLLLGYATLFLTVPLVRYFILQVLNTKIGAKNQMRLARANQLQQLPPALAHKLEFARQFATTQEVVDANNLAYTTETDLIDQEYKKMLEEKEE